MSDLSITIIDDEQEAGEALEHIVAHFYPQANVNRATGVGDGVELLKQMTPDLVFLDIEMRDGTGFDLLTKLGNIDFPVVFVTAHSEYAIKAIKFSALDYILKPADPMEIKAVIDGLDKISNTTADKVEALKHNWGDQVMDKLVLSDLSGFTVVKTADIIRCQGVANYTHFFMNTGDEIVVSVTLKHYEELLASQGFLRVHHSHLINLNHLVKFNKTDGGEVIMSNNDAVNVSARKRDVLLDALKRLPR